jgi:hypothetical protein
VSIHLSSRRVTDPRVARLPWAELPGVRVGLVLWGGLAVVDLGRVTAAPSYAVLAALAVLVTVSSVGVRLGTALCVAVVGWLIVNGFVVHSLGVLRFDGTPDTARLALLVALAAAATRVRR